MFTSLIAIVYLLISFLFYGLWFAYWQRNWDKEITEKYYKGDLLESVFYGILWPISVFIFIINGKFCGFKFK